MKEFKIKIQNDIILAIIDTLKTSIFGKGFRHLHHIKLKRGHYDSTIEFKRKDGDEIKLNELFMLGYFSGRDYK